MALLPLLGNQFVSCGMDGSICHFDAFSHTKYFIHNFLRVPAPEEDVVGPGHGEGDELLQLPTAGAALGVGSARRGRAARGGQVAGVAEQKLPAVAPVFVRLALAAQRLHPGGHPRVLAQVLRHLLRHVGPAGRGGREPALRREGAGARGPVPAACTGGPPENAPREAHTPDNSAPSRRTAHFRPSPAPSLL